MDVAQLGECLPYKQEVAGSRPVVCTADEWNGMTIPGSYPVCDSGFDSRVRNLKQKRRNNYETKTVIEAIIKIISYASVA